MQTTTEVFVGGLPRAAASLSKVEAGLHDALAKFSGGPVAIRMHTKTSGEGRGFAFAWLPNAEIAERLSSVAEIYFDLDGVRTRAGVRAARGRPVDERRPPPTISEPGLEKMSIAFVALDAGLETAIMASFTAWQQLLRRFSIGLEVQLLAPLAGDMDVSSRQLERAQYSDVLLLVYRRGASELSEVRMREWAARAISLADAGRTVLVVEATGVEATGEADLDATRTPCCGTPSQLPASTATLAEAIRASAVKVAAAGQGCRVDLASAEELHNLYGSGNGDGGGSGDGDGGCGGTHEALAIVTLAVRRAVGRRLSSTLKVFVADCDGTLWDGVCSEDGAAGVHFGASQLALHAALSRLQRSGRLLCLASKNEEADVLDVFSTRGEAMGVHLGQLTAWQVHWESKVRSLQRLAESLELPLSSFVFLDDSPHELLEVQAALPDVLCIRIPGSADELHALCKHHWALDAWAAVTTAEDTLRTQLYREKAARKAARREMRHLPLSAFLRELGLRVEVRRPADVSELARVAQLTMRTNQMNSTLLRFASEEELRLWLDSAAVAAAAAGAAAAAAGEAVAAAAAPSVGTPGPAAMMDEARAAVAQSSAAARWITAAWVSDRYGQYGLVSCALCHSEASTVVVECFNLSCRALRRGVELTVLKRVAADGRERGASWVALPLIASEGGRKGNLLMQRFMLRLREWCCKARAGTEGQEAVAAVKEEGEAAHGRHAMVTVGKSAERRGVGASALLLHVSELEGIDAAAWLDTEQDAEAPAGEAEAGAAVGDSAAQDGAREEAAAEEAGDARGPEAAPSAAAAMGRREHGREAASGGRLQEAPGRWSELLEHAAVLGGSLVQSVQQSVSSK